MSKIAQVVLNDGRSIPQLGMGTYKLTPAMLRELLPQAIELGFRHFDTAEFYQNEEGVGSVVRSSALPREDFFVTSKLWNSHHDDPRAALEASLERMGLDYLDLYLIHWPAPEQGLFVSAWEALIAARKVGLVRSIGVSNFMPEHIDRMVEATGVVPAVNQIEMHPSLTQDDVLTYNASRGITTQAWSPIGRAKDLALPAVVDIAAETGRTPSQVVLRWHMQRGCVVFPKSGRIERHREHMGAFDFVLTDDQISRITACDSGNRTGFHPTDSPEVTGDAAAGL